MKTRLISFPPYEIDDYEDDNGSHIVDVTK